MYVSDRLAILSGCIVLLGGLTATAQPFLPARGTTQPVISEEAVPLERIAPLAHDGFEGLGYLRRPPGAGPFPAVLLIPGGGSPRDGLRGSAMGAYASRFLEAGYAVAVITYRNYGFEDRGDWSRAQTDAMAALSYLKALPSIAADSVAVSGCSIGGDVALELAAEVQIPALVVEEPGTAFITGMYRNMSVSEEARDQLAEFRELGVNYTEYFTDAVQNRLERKLKRIAAPLLLVQGDRPVGTDIFLPLQHSILIPALESAGVATEILRFPDLHCFAMTSVTPAGVSAFSEIEAFISSRLVVEPRAIDAGLVEHVPASVNIGRQTILLPPEVLEAYAGTYRQSNESAIIQTNSQGALLTIRVDGNALIGQIGSGQPVRFTPESEFVFFSEIGDVAFVTDDDGDVTGMVYRNDLTFERVE